MREDESETLDRFFAALSWVPVDDGVARVAGSLARRRRKAYSGIDGVDYLSAAIALILDAKLLTTNVRHFPMTAGLRPCCCTVAVSASKWLRGRCWTAPLLID